LGTHKQKILFIGYGHLAKSLISKKLLSFANIHALNSRNVIKSINLKKKISKLNTNYNYVFLLIRPNTFVTIGTQFQKYLSKDTVVISCMAGIKLSTIEKTLKTKKTIRIMPNVMALNTKSQTHIYTKNKNLFNSKLKKLLSFFGTIIKVSNEDQINFATSVFGSGPAFIAYIVNIFVKAAKRLAKPYNMNEKNVIELFKNVLETNQTSKILDAFVSSISSKKGTTQAGINYIKSQKIEKIIYTTLYRAYKRAKEIDSEKKNTKSQ
tara:strand:+ start:789 stop:1586 length:798 start_codon:yes stop_codon:yes gene_type:complete